MRVDFSLTHTVWSAGMLLFALLLSAGSAVAQDPQDPPEVYTGSLGGGVAITGGNTDTDSFNLGAELRRDDGGRNVIEGSASYLRGDQNGTLNLDRTSVNLRDEFTFSGRTFVFGQVDYVRDRFKGIIFLWAPTGGLGHRLIDSDAMRFVVRGGAGGVLEKNPGLDADTSGSLTAGQKFTRSLSSSAKLTQSLSTIWKTDDFADSLTNFSISVTTTLVGSLEVKVEFADTYKNKPSDASFEKNDTAFVTAFVVKF
jgi:putative salt-induced outer membrane protein